MGWLHESDKLSSNPVDELTAAEIGARVFQVMGLR
jgi:hypothetical protein